jgi:hypothetical protein
MVSGERLIGGMTGNKHMPVGDDRRQVDGGIIGGIGELYVG